MMETELIIGIIKKNRSTRIPAINDLDYCCNYAVYCCKKVNYNEEELTKIIINYVDGGKFMFNCWLKEQEQECEKIIKETNLEILVPDDPFPIVNKREKSAHLRC
jgi:hypothetical protein